MIATSESMMGAALHDDATRAEDLMTDREKGLVDSIYSILAQIQAAMDLLCLISTDPDADAELIALDARSILIDATETAIGVHMGVVRDVLGARLQ